MKIVLASNNVGKIREFREIAKHPSLELISQATLKVNDIEETACTFVENALLKARHAAEMTGLPAIADDSGLVVKALQGAPGVYSARYAGLKATAHDNIQKLLASLKDEKDRTAYFYCVLVFLTSAKDPKPIICEGVWQGTILEKPRGENGFGYDPVFFDHQENMSAAEMPPHKKNLISHRAKALQLLSDRLKREILC